MVSVVTLSKKVDLKNSVLVEGFPGIGLVGTIAAGYLVEKLDMELIGFVESNKLPPITTIHQGQPLPPIRLYKHKSKGFVVLLAEFIVPANSVEELSDCILEFVRKNKIRQIVSLAGMSSPKADDKPIVYGIASNREMLNYLKLKGVPLIQEGITTGVSGTLISKCSRSGFPAVSLLAESRFGYPDPRASAALLQKLDSLIGLQVDTKSLLEEAAVVEARVRKMMSQMKNAQTSYERAEEDYPSTYH